MLRSTTLLFSVTILFSFLSNDYCLKDWGFFGHRLINKTAVFTLPVDLMPLYKSNIDFVTEHAVDPDKRRYASKLEAVRHYIDIDLWGKYPFEDVPRKLSDAMLLHSSVHAIVRESRDTLKSWKNTSLWDHLFSEYQKNRIREELIQRVFEIQEEGFIQLPAEWLPEEYDMDGIDLIFTEHFTKEGILPYHLSFYQARLTKAFKEQNWPLVIRLSTEMGHYISDAHVPLHTTVNYNGQLTGQDGIHAFWESRIPELFAIENYDFFVGRAKYVEDTDRFFWDIILDSHSYVEEVLSKELELRHSFDKDKQFCFQERGAVTSRMECRAYAQAYQDAMEGMVEQQMRKAIQSVGSSWYTAWIDAGRPKFSNTNARLDIDTTQTLPADTIKITRL